MLVSSPSAQSSVAALCKMMPDMEECKECVGGDDGGGGEQYGSCADPLLSYSRICLSMEMDGCQDWKQMCTSNVGLVPFCGEEGGEGRETCSGVMRMYFHNGWDDVVLFQSWVPCSVGKYVATCVGVILLGVIVAFLKVIRVRLECRFERSVLLLRDSRPGGGAVGGGGAGGAHAAERGERGERRGGGDTPVEAPLLTLSSISVPRDNGEEGFFAGILPRSGLEVKQNVLRGVLVSVTLALDYSLMLVAMTFNIGLFVAVCLGVGLGSVLFGHNGLRKMQGGGAGEGGGVALSSVLQERACCS